MVSERFSMVSNVFMWFLMFFFLGGTGNLNPNSQAKTMQIRFLENRTRRATKNHRYSSGQFSVNLIMGSNSSKQHEIDIFVILWNFSISCQSLRAQFLNAVCLTLGDCYLMPGACLMHSVFGRPPFAEPFVDGSGRCSSIKQQAASKHQAASIEH